MRSHPAASIENLSYEDLIRRLRVLAAMNETLIAEIQQLQADLAREHRALRQTQLACLAGWEDEIAAAAGIGRMS